MTFFENAVIFDRFQIIEKLSEDAVFSSYLGKNLDNGSKVFVKILNPDRFTRYEVDKICYSNEISTIKSFDHKNIMRVLESGPYSNTICVVSEYIGSTRLDTFLKGRGALDIPTAINLISQLASAVRYAHSKGILHRNINASNIGIYEENGDFVLKLFDFGLSYVIDLTAIPADMVDTYFGSMAPESTGLLDRKVDIRSDLYSLGIMLYRFVTGNYPFHADTIDNMVYQHVAVMPKVPTEFNPAVPETVSKLILKLLSKDPDQRYSSANELINDLDLFLSSSFSDLHVRDEDLLQTMDQRSRLLSRKYELAQLRNHYTKALKGSGRFCLVKGSLGSGKSDLFANLCNELKSSNIPYFRAHFSAQTTMTPYSAFHDILEAFTIRFENYDRKLQLTERSRLARTLMGLSDLAFKICPEMKKILPESLALPTLEGFREQQRSVMLLASFFLTLQAQGGPFVIILDDIHFADPASLALLTEMSNHINNHPVFVVCSCRDSEISDTGYLSAFLKVFNQNALFSEITLSTFTEERMCEYLSDLLILDKDDCQILASYINDKTGGNPYYAINIIRSMIEDQVISVNNGKLEQNWDQLRIINQAVDVFQLIERRITRLSEEAVKMLETAAIIGDCFPVEVLRLVMRMSRDQIIPLINSAINLQFIQYSSTDDVMEFSHRDIHSVFTARVTGERLRMLHFDIAKAIEALQGELEHDIYGIVSHYAAAGADTELRKYILPAASMARLAGANTEALVYYTKALELIVAEGGEGSEDWCISTSALVDLNLLAGNCDAAIEAANRLMPHMPDNIARAKLLHRIALAYYRLNDYMKCRNMLTSALEQFDIKFPTTTGDVRMRTTSLRWFYKLNKKVAPDPTARLGRPDSDAAAAKTVMAIYETLCQVFAYTDLDRFTYTAFAMYKYAHKHLGGKSSEFATALSAMSVLHQFESNISEAEQCQMLATKLRTAEEDVYSLARSNFFKGLREQWTGQAQASIKSFADSLEGYKAAGDIWECNNVNMNICYSYLMKGAHDTCEQLCLQCIDESERLSDTFSLAMAHICLIINYTNSGNRANAEEAAKRCRSLIEELNLPYVSVHYYNSYARLLIEIGKFNDAAALLFKAKTLLDKFAFAPTYSALTYGYLAMAKNRMLDRDRSALSLNEVQNAEFDIGSYCEKALALAQSRPNQLIVAYRASGMFGITTERLKRTMLAYREAAELTSKSEYYYENSMFDYEYGQYLLSQHRNNEARFFIFEAYMGFANINSTIHMKECEKIIADKYKDDFADNSLMSEINARKSRMNADRRVNTLLRLGERLTSTLQLEELQRKILQDAVELVGAERGILFLYPETGDKKLYVASVYNLGSFDCNTYDWMLEEVENYRKPIVINDVQSDEYRKHYSVMARYGIKSVMAMPMFVHGVLFGVIYLDSRLVRQIFTDDYIEAMGFIANQAGAPIENARLYHRAITDGLTGIYGRSYLDNLVIDLTSDENATISAIMIDVDNFKRCNDTYGHPFGDKVLRQIAGIMKRIAGDSGTPCRYGGEEFVVLLDSNDPEYVLDIANKIRQTVENSTLACNNGTDVALVSVTISLGVSIWDSSMERVDLIEHADKALYYAKQHGKNQAVLWNESIG